MALARGLCLGNQKMIAAPARIKSIWITAYSSRFRSRALSPCDAKRTRKDLRHLSKRRDVLVTDQRADGAEKPRGSMFLWAPVPEKYRRGLLEFCKLLLEKARVAVSPGIGFGPLGEGHVRFALVENEQRIRQATRAIGQFLKA
jgi:alanine-synthesizing transaminase